MGRKKNKIGNIGQVIEAGYNTAIPDLDTGSSTLDVLEKLKDGFKWDNLTETEKLLAVKYYKDQGRYTLDEIAKHIGISRGTAAKYSKQLKKLRAYELSVQNIWELGGDLYVKYKSAYRLAMKEKQPKAAAYVLSNMISTLQSMGLVYKAPTRQQIQAAIKQHTIHSQESVKGYNRFVEALKGKELTYEQILNELMEAVKEDKLTEGQREDTKNGD